MAKVNCVNKYLIIYEVDGEQFLKPCNSRELIDFADSLDYMPIDNYEFYQFIGMDKGLQTIRYRGWQPKLVIEFIDDKGNVVVSGYGTDH